MNYLQLVNKVLVRLREDEVSSVSQNSYSRLIGNLINETKREVEDSWNWILLRDTIQIATVAGTLRYTLTGAGDRFKGLFVYDSTSENRMRLISSQRMTEYHLSDDNELSQPLYYDFNGATGGDPNVDVYPIPDGEYLLNFDMVIPQAELDEDTDELITPIWPTILWAYAKSIDERGEDGGTMLTKAETRYMTALSDAIATDASNVPHETLWSVV